MTTAARKWTNNELILCKVPGLLTSLDQQRRFLLLQAIVPRRSECGHTFSKIGAIGGNVGDYDADSLHEPLFECPRCGKEVRYILPVGGLAYFAVVGP